MKSLITSALLLLALLMPAAAAANPITRQQAHQNALTFLESKGKSFDNSSLRQAPSRSSLTETESYFVFNIGDNEGYVIASGDDCAPAILGYADSGYLDLDSLPENMKFWLEEYARQIQFMQEKGYTSSHQTGLSSNLTAISPLLTTSWGQNYPYNKNCPDFFGYGKCVTGCVATAMAQVMYYHRSNSVSQTTATIPAYTCYHLWNFGNDAQRISVDSIPAGSLIDWNGMIDSYNGNESAMQKQAVANLMKYCGASVQMDYANARNGGSTAQSENVPIALKTYFNYNNCTSLKNRNRFSSDDEWNNLIYDELRNSRPVYYSGTNYSTGHAFVCDGYDGEGYFHINWGWDGNRNGYFLLSALDPGGDPSSGYDLNQKALINAFPKPNNPIPSEIISFADPNVKALCVKNWDFDGDGEFSEAEAAAVTTLKGVFSNNRSITSFNELKYFTGLSRIGNEVFSGCSGLTSVTLPNSVTAIGDNAFAGCSGLTSLPLTNSITTIGIAAFISCSGLTSVTIPNTVTSIGGGAFSNCSNLTSLVVASQNAKYDSRNNYNAIIETASNTLIAGCLNTVIPNSVTAIGEYAFYCCGDLTSITIPNSITSIDMWAFAYCERLTSVIISNSVTSIGEYAFSNCSSLTNINIPNSVTYISQYMFYRCGALSHVTIPNSVASIGEGAFSCCSALTSVTIPNSVTAIGNYAFYSCRALASMTIPNSITSIGDYAFYCCSSMTSMTIPNSVTSIGEYAFSSCISMVSVTIPNSITTIGKCVFAECRGLTSVTIPNSVTSIGEGAFFCCSAMASVTIPNSVTSIGEMAFRSCSGLTSVVIGNSVISIGDMAFRSCSGLTNLSIGKSVTSIGEMAFAECNSLADIVVDSSNPKYDSRNNNNAIIETLRNTLILGCKNTVVPNSVTAFGDYAFYYCSGLTSLTIPSSVISIGKYAFTSCHGLTSLTLPDSVSYIGDYAFSSCSGLTNIDIPNSVTYISRYTFFNCSALSHVTIPNSVSYIGDNAFAHCSGLMSVTIPKSVTSIGNYAFYYCSGLTSMKVPSSVTSIGDGAFQGCRGLTSLTIGNSVTSIGYAAFATCPSLADVYSYIKDPSRVVVGRYAFRDSNDDYSGRTLHVPHGTAGDYQTEEDWHPYFGQILDDLMLCDVNEDGEVNIADINAVIYIILRGNSYSIAADVNGDDEINIADINAIIDVILGS